MPHKRILIAAIGFCVFAAAAVMGYVMPDIAHHWRKLSLSRDFVPANVPADISGDFAAAFQKMHASTERQRLPDGMFIGPDGKPMRFADFEGKPLLVNFWATWCAPCVVELPSLQKFRDHYRGKLEVIAVSLEEGKDEATLRSFLEKRGIGDFAAYSDKEAAIAKEVNIRGLPTSFLVGKNGDILYRFEGDADWTSPESKAFFDVFLFQNR